MCVGRVIRCVRSQTDGVGAHLMAIPRLVGDRMHSSKIAQDYTLYMEMG